MYRINIYQVDSRIDTYNMLFMNLPWTLKHCGGRVPSEVYVNIYTEESNEEPNLQQLFMRLNFEIRPLDYHGRSMSVSDVVEVISDSETKAYYCKCEGFEEIEFDSSHCAEQKEYCKDGMGRTIYVY